MINIHRRPRRLPLFLFVVCVLVFSWHTGWTAWNSPYINYNGVRFRKSGFDWGKQLLHHPTRPPRPLPTGTPIEFPRVQHDFANDDVEGREDVNSRRIAVRDAFIRSWNGYKKHAWMFDELVPVSGAGRNTFGGWAATMVDALDTMWIMGLHDDFDHAVRAVSMIDWANTTETSVNMFETTIRHLGGLLSAYDLSHEHALLAKAVELGDMLYVGFDTPNRMPPFWFSFKNAKSGKQSAEDRASSAAGCSLSMEFTRLSQITGDPKYYDATERVKEFLVYTQNQTKLPGLWPMYMNYRRERVDDSTFTLGAQSDSLYEYLPKMHALLGGLDPAYRNMTIWSLDSAKQHLLFRPMTPEKEDILFSGNAVARAGVSELVPEGQHLGCFVGGMYGLAGKLLSRADYVSVGERVALGCAWAYKSFPTGIMPEVMTLIPCTTPDLGPCEWDEEEWVNHGTKTLEKGFKGVHDFRYLLRPEAIESIFYMYRITGKEQYRDIAWTMFQSIQNATETPLAYSAISNVNAHGQTTKLDSMESFWFSETLKYFYLIFSPPDLISLDDWVFNTEAHPFRRPESVDSVQPAE